MKFYSACSVAAPCRAAPSGRHFGLRSVVRRIVLRNVSHPTALRMLRVPALAGWANFWRASGADRLVGLPADQYYPREDSRNAEPLRFRNLFPQNRGRSNATVTAPYKEASTLTTDTCSRRIP